MPLEAGLSRRASAARLSAGGIPEAKNTEAMIRTKNLFIGTPVMVQG